MNLNKLLEETPQAYYWAGFLMADGCFSKDARIHCNGYYTLILTLADKDKSHVRNFMRFMETNKSYHNVNKKYTSTHFCSSKSDLFIKVMNKFNFKFKKTYNPPNELKILSDDFFLSFLIGFIDGDGYIGTKNTIQIQCHKNWKKCLDDWFLRLQKISEIGIDEFRKRGIIKSYIEKKKTYNTNGEYVRIRVGRRYIIDLLQNKIKKLRLPVLKRKWNTITNSKIDYKIIGKVVKLLKKGYKNSDILKILGLKNKVNRNYVSKIKYRYMVGV